MSAKEGTGIKSQPMLQNASTEDRRLRFRLGRQVFAGAVLATFLLGGIGGWAATAQLSGAVIAQGVVAVDRQVKEVQHRDGGIVAEIAVEEGDLVHEGQVLIRLDDAQTRAELSIIRSQLAEYTGREARLMAERDEAEQIEFPAGYRDSHAGAARILEAETRLFQGNLEKRLSQTEQLELQIEQLFEEIKGLEAQAESKDREISLVTDHRGRIHSLAEKGYAERTRVYSIDREMTELIGERAEIRANTARAHGRINEIRLQILSVNDDARTEAQSELRSVSATLSELTERETAVKDRLERTEIRAPLSGVVNDLDVHTISGVITPAQRILTIVPLDAQLQVEVKLAPNDIEQVFVGQEARLRFSAFNHRTTPEIEGTVSHVPAASTRDEESGQPYYRGRIRIGDISGLGDVVLLPGMPVEVFIQTQELTALAYLAKPFTDQMNRAFREE